MLAALKRLFAPAVSQPADPHDPTYVPAPKAKVPGAMHPGVRAKLMNPVQGRARGVGVVYDAAGRPKVTKDWLDHLTKDQRAAVDANLAAHGWKLTPNNTVERI